jgi:hypothetical protein
VLSTPPAFVLSQDQTLQKNLILCNVTQGNLTDLLLKTRHFQKPLSLWKLCTYLVFKDHNLHSLQNRYNSEIYEPCQELYRTI